MGWRAQRSFPSRLETPAEGRAFIVETISARLPTATRVCEDAQLMASELLTNSVKAGARTVTIALSADESVLRLEVSDDGGGAPTVRSPTEQDVSGRGLLIVATVADRWAIVVEPGVRTAVWAELNLATAACQV